MSFVKVSCVLCVLWAVCACSPSAPSTTTTTTPAPTAPYTLNGRVVQAFTSNGIANASMTLTSPSDVVMNTTTDATGAFSFSGLTESGTFRIDTNAAGYVPAETAMAIPVTSTFTILVTPIN
jgi:hypothetical protein